MKTEYTKTISQLLSAAVDHFVLALHHDNGARKGQNNNGTATKHQNSTESKMLEHKSLSEEFAKLKKILDIVKGMFCSRKCGLYFNSSAVVSNLHVHTIDLAVLLWKGFSADANMSTLCLLLQCLQDSTTRCDVLKFFSSVEICALTMNVKKANIHRRNAKKLWLHLSYAFEFDLAHSGIAA